MEWIKTLEKNLNVKGGISFVCVLPKSSTSSSSRKLLLFFKSLSSQPCLCSTSCSALTLLCSDTALGVDWVFPKYSHQSDCRHSPHTKSHQCLPPRLHPLGRGLLQIWEPPGLQDFSSLQPNLSCHSQNWSS